MISTIFINIIIAFTLLNVWILRFNKKTKYRGGDATSMSEEFSVYGLPNWSMYITGALKISIAILLITGLWIKELNIYSYIVLSILMIGAILMHIKVKDPIIKSLPALSILSLLLAQLSSIL